MNDTMVRRPRLLLVAFECSPQHGSEWANGWHRACEAARRYETWVITRGDHQAEEIRQHLAEHGPITNLHFEFLPCPGFPPRPVHVGGRLWLAYSAWQREVRKCAEHLHAKHKFDLFHQVTNTGFREPGYLAELDAPFIWGPIGGTHNYPWRFLAEAGLKGALTEGLRSVANTLQFRFSRRVRRAARRARVMLASNSTSCEQVRRAHGVRPVELLDVGIPTMADQPRDVRQAGQPLRILWSGQFAPRKALSLLLRALQKMPPDARYELRVVGGGPLEKRWKKLAHRLGINQHIDWRGWVPHAEARQQYNWADVFVFTSLRDNSGTVVLEAMGAGVPIVCLDHQGVRDMVTPECGIKIPVTNRRRVVYDLVAALTRLSNDIPLCARLGAAAHERARDYLWSNLGTKMAEIYRDVLREARSGAVQPSRWKSAKKSVRPALRSAAIWGVARAAAGMQAAFGRRAGNGFGILTYHRIAQRTPGFAPPTWNATPNQFRRQLEGLLRRGYQPWSLSELLSARAAGQHLPPGVFAVTFDDGYENNFTEALPILEMLGVPATVFLATAYLDRSESFPFDDWSCCGVRGVPAKTWRPLTTSQCRQMLKSGLIEFGTHTHTHQVFSNRLQEFARDLESSIEWLHGKLGVRNPVLAFPHGVFNQSMLDVASELGIPCALTTVPGLRDLSTDPLGWGRFSVESHDTAATLAGKLGGWYTPITRGFRALVGPNPQPTTTLPNISLPVELASDEDTAEHDLVCANES